MKRHVNSQEWTYNHRKEKEWIIEKKKTLICFGYPGTITQWDYWDSYDTEQQAIEALTKLNDNRDLTSKTEYRISKNRNMQWILK